MKLLLKKVATLLAPVLIVPIVLFAPSTVSAQSANTLGVHRGGAPDQVGAYEKWLGKPVSHVVDFMGRAPSGSTNPWKNIDAPGWMCDRWKNKPWTAVVTTAMLPNKDFTLEAGARGEYNAHWQRFAKTMVSRGCPDVILRLGHEFNGRFYPWSAYGKEAAFASYWRQIVDTLRKVPGQAFKYDWNPLAGVVSVNVEAAYPGDNYVDIIGLDAYDTTTTQNVTDPAKRWKNQLERPYGLNWHAKFARAHAKPMSFPEWGVSVRPKDNLGGGDNPYYITQTWNWIKSNNFVYAAYFEYDAPVANHRLMTTQFPKASAEYRRLVNAG